MESEFALLVSVWDSSVLYFELDEGTDSDPFIEKKQAAPPIEQLQE